MYKLRNLQLGGQDVQRLSDNAFIPFDPANTDYQQFVWQINHDKAELEDADGNLMTPEEAKAFVATLPKVSDSSIRFF